MHKSYPSIAASSDLEMRQEQSEETAAATIVRTSLHGACQTCRKRKSRCDKKRPQCDLCQRLNLACEYREVLPTKKDKTLEHILSLLESVDQKLNLLLLRGTQVGVDNTSSPNNTSMGHCQNDMELLEGRITDGFICPSIIENIIPQDAGMSGSLCPRTPRDSPVSFERHIAAQQTTEVHRLLKWPAVKSMLQNYGADVPQWRDDARGAERWLNDISSDLGAPLPFDESVDVMFTESGKLDLDRRRSITLTKSYVETLCSIYFQSFHCIYPILERAHFFANVLPLAYSNSFSESCQASTLVLVVLALGTLAHDGACGTQMDDPEGRPTGVRGGTVCRPPGLLFMSEAKRRLGVTFMQWNLEYLQCYILSSVYYSQCSRNIEFFRTATFSCTVCNSIVRSISQWESVESDRIARCFWTCCIFQGGLNGELGLDIPGIMDLEGHVPIPLFLSDTVDYNDKTEMDLFIEFHFLAQVALRTLINRAKRSQNEHEKRVQMCYDEVTAYDAIAHELQQQLSKWRSHLPIWFDVETVDTTSTQTDRAIDIDVEIVGDLATFRLPDFKVILNAALQTRYRYTKYTIWKPYIKRVLHTSGSYDMRELEGCRQALEACCLWPLTLERFQYKCLLPQLYEHTYAIFGILILFQTFFSNPKVHPLLLSVMESHELKVSKKLYLGWMRDMKIVHPVAKWSWQLLKIIYREHSLVREEASDLTQLDQVNG